MAPSSSVPTTITIIILIIITCTLIPSKVQPFKAPILPQDLLPILPKQLSWTILRSLKAATDILPTFVGAVAGDGNDDDGGGVTWKGSCFYENDAWLEFHNKTGSQFGGGTLHIK
ncbi:hypothetical protein Tco_1414304, partial [Tanacetum coccineum]